MPLLWEKSPKKAALASYLGKQGTRILKRAIWQHPKLTKWNALGLPSPCFEDRIPSEKDPWPGAAACADLPLSPASPGLRGPQIAQRTHSGPGWALPVSAVRFWEVTQLP